MDQDHQRYTIYIKFGVAILKTTHYLLINSALPNFNLFQAITSEIRVNNLIML